MKIGSHFLDSGAFTQYTQSLKFQENTGKDRLEYYNTSAFWTYMKRYVQFIKKYNKGIDLYANVDVIGCPELTWRNQQWLEKKGVKPIPIVHYGTDPVMRWMGHYINKGYDLIGLGNMAFNTTRRSNIIIWLNDVFDYICDSKGMPKIKLHGFGISSVSLWIKYPWYSVDSTSIHKKSGYGWILVPYYSTLKKKYLYVERPPLHVSISEESPLIKTSNNIHYSKLNISEKQMINQWLKHIKIPLGNKKIKGVLNNGTLRKIALFMYYEKVTEALPQWPWRFKRYNINQRVDNNGDFAELFQKKEFII